MIDYKKKVFNTGIKANVQYFFVISLDKDKNI